MAETTVTRNGHITLSKEVRNALQIREGDTMIVNYYENVILISKRTLVAWDNIRGGSLPKNFEKIIKTTRIDTHKRLKRLGILNEHSI